MFICKHASLQLSSPALSLALSLENCLVCCYAACVRVLILLSENLELWTEVTLDLKNNSVLLQLGVLYLEVLTIIFISNNNIALIKLIAEIWQRCSNIRRYKKHKQSNDHTK